jgi:parallel beta-helix repeat protein
LPALLLIVLISIVISLSSFPRGTCQLRTETATITVPDDYSSIQAAINAANEGDTVYVRNGTYYEVVDVNKSISLVGANKMATIIDGSNFTNFSVLGVSDVSNATVQNLTVQNGAGGLFLGNVSYLKLRNINLRSNQQNIVLYDPTSLQNTTQDIDESNTVDGKPIYFWNNKANEEVPSDASYVALINCNNITVQGPNITKDAIVLVNVKNCLVENATITETQMSLQTFGVDNCTIRNSVLNNSVFGVGLWNFNHCSFTNNTISNVTQDDALTLSGTFSTMKENTILNNRGYYGLHVMGDYNLISTNKILNNTYGIKIEHSNNNNVSSNQIEGNLGSQLELFNSSFNTISENRIVGKYISDFPLPMGLTLGYYSNNNTIIGNLIEGNYYGIQIMGSENNLIFHNNIEDNDIQAQVYPAGGGYSNIWDNGYPSGGNHWSDYTGIDSDHDGIGDDPYVIYDGNIDNYPLMNPYVVPEFYYMMYLPLFVFSTLAAAAIWKKKRKLKP